jgi:hypothetical protein
MRTVFFFILSISIAQSCELNAQEHTATLMGKNLRIQKLVRDVLGRTITLNFKGGETKTGELVRANGIEFTLEVQGTEEIFQTGSIRSFTKKAGLSEGVLVLLSAGVAGGFGLGSTALLFNGASSETLTVAAVLFGLLGGWLGYDSFFQDVEIELP